MNDYPENDTANHCALCAKYREIIDDYTTAKNWYEVRRAQDAYNNHLRSHERAAVEWRGGVKWVEVRR